MDRKFLFQFHQIPELCCIQFSFNFQTLIRTLSPLHHTFSTPFRSDPLVSPQAAQTHYLNVQWVNDTVTTGDQSVL